MPFHMRSLRQHGDGPLSRNRRAALSFWDADHGDGSPTCWSASDELLHREGADHASGEVWLHTYPRVFGFHLQARQFRHCHAADGLLAAIVAEVNNTFRRAPLLPLANLRYAASFTQARARTSMSPFCAVGDHWFSSGSAPPRPSGWRASGRSADDQAPADPHQHQRPAANRSPGHQRHALWAYCDAGVVLVAGSWGAGAVFRKPAPPAHPHALIPLANHIAD